MTRTELLEIINASKETVLQSKEFKQKYESGIVKRSENGKIAISNSEAILISFELATDYSNRLILEVLEKVLVHDSQNL